MTFKVPFVDPREHYRRYRAEFEAALTETLARGDLVMRGHLAAFESHVAEFVGVKYAVGVGSGYHALHLSMVAAGLGPGCEVITVAHTFVATISAIVHCGATPVLVDVGADYTIDPDAFERAITPRTKAVVPVHLNGRIADMTRIMSIAEARKLIVIEDAAQACGATLYGRRAGSFGRTGCFSFYPFKILGAFGDAGAVMTDDDDVARAVRLLRYNGEDRDTGEYHYHGYTALLDNVQAAVLDVKLRHVPSWIAHRRMIAERYRQGLSGVGDLRLPHFPTDDRQDVYQNYVIRTARRDDLQRHLHANGVETLLHWPKPVWCHAGLRLPAQHLPETEAICREVVSLPMSAETTPDQVDEVVRVVREFWSQPAPAPVGARVDRGA